MSKNTFSTMPLSSALTVRRRQNADDSVTAAHAAMERMVLAGIQSGASFTATVRVSGASLSASFNLQDSQNPSHRPHTARAAATATPAPAVQPQRHVQPMSTARPSASSSAAGSMPPCRSSLQLGSATEGKAAPSATASRTKRRGPCMPISPLRFML